MIFKPTLKRNKVYRYKSITDKNGQKYILLFGASQRSYGDDIDTFKSKRFDLINLVGSFDIPEISIAK